ncbi:MAG TPA: PQQ-binding-like beta-propeller repeat protein [Streptosporangiaceae bacterium]
MRQKIGDRGRRRLARAPLALLTTLLCAVGVTAAGSATAGALAGSPRSVRAAAGSSEDWASFHRTGLLDGWAASSSVTTANASKLGVRWAADLYGGAVDSPVEAFDSTLGERLAYIGTQNHDVVAVNLANGRIVWATSVGNQVRPGPVVANGAVFVATTNSTKIFKLDATTGAVGCTFTPPRQIEGTPVAATPPGGVPTVYFGANDTNSASGPVYALKQSNCAQEWAFTGYASTAGSWDPLTYAVDAKGTPLVLLGTADPDSKVYAINAVTGKEVWRFATDPPPGDYDVGAGVVASPPGTNGFADGMAYVENKFGTMFGLNLTTGAKVWAVRYTEEIHSLGRNISTPALSGENLVLGDANGLVDLNPLNGNVVWHNDDPAKAGVDSSPAIAGPAGSQVVTVGDLASGFDVDSLATGKLLYHYQAGQYITASPAVSGGDILIASADGFLYDFAVGGGNESTLPANTVTSPVDSSKVANPNGQITVKGSATDHAGITQVLVGVQASGPDGPWWNARAGKWGSGPSDNPATLASPGGTSSGWTFSYPVPASGDVYQVAAYTVSAAGQSSVVTGGTGFTVLPSTSSPQLQTSAQFVPPTGQMQVSGSGFGASETVTIALAGTKLATAKTTASGSVPATTVTIPATTAFGLTSLDVTGQSSGKAGAAGITIASTWAQAGYGPTHTGFEPNDQDIFNSIAAGNGTFMNLAWAFGTAAAVSGPPAVADTVAYVPDAGHLTAVDAHFGSPLWTWSRAGAALDGSPAVDIADGLVFVGANDGTLDAISTRTGKMAWSDTIGGDVSAPVPGGGQVYVTSSTGAIEAVAETTGAVVWSKTLTHPASAALALDLTGKRLVVGESNGDVTSLSLSGTSQWSHSTGSAAVTTPPAVAAGVVYAGAGDSVYAINENTGAASWSYTTGGMVSNSLTVNSTGVAHRGVIVAVGSADGDLYGIHAADGKDLWKINMGGGPITGVASAYQIYIFDTSKGVIGAGRVTSGLRDWKRVTTAGAMTSPVAVDGTIYAGGTDSELYAYTTDGQPPA